MPLGEFKRKFFNSSPIHPEVVRDRLTQRCRPSASGNEDSKLKHLFSVAELRRMNVLYILFSCVLFPNIWQFSVQQKTEAEVLVANWSDGSLVALVELIQDQMADRLGSRAINQKAIG